MASLLNKLRGPPRQDTPLLRALKVMTFNVRHDNGGKSFAEPPEVDLDKSDALALEQPWSIRKWKVADAIMFHAPDIVGLQETYKHQLTDLESLLGGEYGWVGVARDDGKEVGEFCPVLYKRDLFTVNEWHTMWLSETPNTPGSKSWDSRHPRIVTVVKLQRKTDQSAFVVLNTHLDHFSAQARAESAKLLLNKAQSLPGPVILLGDLNACEDEEAYHILTGDQYKDRKGFNDTTKNLVALNNQAASDTAERTGQPVRTTENSISLPTHRVIRKSDIMASLARGNKTSSQNQSSPIFDDTRYLLETPLTHVANGTSLSGPYGHPTSYTGFGDPKDSKPKTRIDHVLVFNHNNPPCVKVTRYGILSNQFEDGLYISDHRPVIATVIW